MSDCPTFAESETKRIAANALRRYGLVLGAHVEMNIRDAIYAGFKSATTGKKLITNKVG
jgi:hypothetical protein